MQIDWVEQLQQARLYAIIDTSYLGDKRVDFFAKELVAGGADIIQLRAKQETEAQIREMAKTIHEITCEAKIPLILNDYVTFAAELEVEGVHVGQDDMSIEEVKRIMPKFALIGKSTHSLEQAEIAQQETPNYIGFGPLFATQTKPTYHPIGLELITKVKNKLPIFCIGGIKLNNLESVLEAGARRVVIVSEWMQADSPRDYGKRVRDCLEKYAF